MTFTIKELAEKLGIPETSTYGVVAFLEAKAVVRCMGVAPRPDGGKGRGSKVYTTTSEVKEKLLEAFKELLT